MNRGFDQKNVVVTGAAGGIGAELVKQLGAKGSRVGLISRREERMVELCEEVARAGGTAVYAVADVEDRDSVSAAFSSIQDQLGCIDTMIASAGVGDADAIDPFDAATFERIMRVNWFGLVYAIEAVLPAMLERKQGHLVAVSSLRAFRGLPGFAGYSSSKAAVKVLMEGLRVELRPRGVNVTSVFPGFVQTAMTENKNFPKPWMMQPDAAAQRILHAISRRRKVDCFPWQLTLMTRIGQLMPDWIIDRMAPRETPASKENTIAR